MPLCGSLVLTDRREEPSVVEPVHPFECRKLHGLEVRPRATTTDHFSLVQPDHRLGEGVDAPICQDCCGYSSGDLAARCAGAVVVDEGVVNFTRDESLQAADDVFLGQP